MAASDSEAFESADEDIDEGFGEEASASRDNARQIEKPVGTKKPQDGAEGCPGSSGLAAAHNTDDGWEDFPVDVPDVETEAVEGAGAKSKDTVSATKGSAPAQEEDEGWDFDDWGDEELQTHVASKPEVVHSEREFRQLADKLSSLGGTTETNDSSQGGWGAWGGWGASLLSSSVSQITSHVSQGFNTVSSVIESGMGAPDPEELVKIQKESKMRREQQMQKSLSEASTSVKESENDRRLSDGNPNEEKENAQDNAVGFQLGKLVSSVTKLVETTGSTVITGGLDTLEEIGKRTMKVIQGDEPGGRVKLSTLLREARDMKEEQNATAAGGDQPKKAAPRFEVLFDDYQGLVHLEALEMLSKQCDIKIQTLVSKCHGNELKELQETLEQVKEICELPEYEDDGFNEHTVESFKEQLDSAIKDLNIQLNFEPIINCLQEAYCDEKINDGSSGNVETDKEKGDDSNDIENVTCLAMKQMAQFSALSVQLLHKCAALLSVRDRRSTADEADGLTQLTTVLSYFTGDIASRHSSVLNKLNTEEARSAMTNIYFEAEKGSSYLKDAFQLTVPILQVGAT